MGSIIGALYAFGKTSAEIEKIASEINYLKLIDFELKV
jgi:predicted acylesterase/phospholipase RssA